MFKRNTALILIFSALLAGCSQQPPTCGETSATSSVLKIVKSLAQDAIGPQANDIFDYQLTNIQTTNINNNTGTQTCLADLNLNLKGQNNVSFPIHYRLAKSDSQQNAFITNLEKPNAIVELVKTENYQYKQQQTLSKQQK